MEVHAKKFSIVGVGPRAYDFRLAGSTGIGPALFRPCLACHREEGLVILYV